MSSSSSSSSASASSTSPQADPGAGGRVGLPGPDSRWRCGHCGNLTRFDVVRARRVEEYWHFTMAGEPEVSETQVAAEEVLSVTCRWCGASDRIEIVARPDGDEDPTGLGGTP